MASTFNRNFVDETIVFPDEDDIVQFKYKPSFSHVSIRDIRGRYIQPEGGLICMKVEVKPDSFERRSFVNFQDVFTLETLNRIIEAKTTHLKSDPEMIMSEAYKEMFRSPLCFINNVRPFGITAISALEPFRKHSPVIVMPVQIDGMLETNATDPLSDDTLKIHPSMFVLGDEGVSLIDHTRLNVFIIVDNNFRIKVILTKFDSLNAWLTNTPQGNDFKSGAEKYLCFIKLGYTHDRRADKTVVCQNNRGYWCLNHFIFDPEIDWTTLVLEKANKFSKFCNEFFGGVNWKLGIPVKLSFKTNEHDYKLFDTIIREYLKIYSHEDKTKCLNILTKDNGVPFFALMGDFETYFK